MWTLFWDMHSGGNAKEKWEKIYIEAPEDRARVIFYNRFGHSADRVSCTCCGEDYAVSSAPSLAQVSGWHRGCQYDDVKKKYVEVKDTKFSFHKEHVTVEQYKKLLGVLVIAANEIKKGEDKGEVPEQGYVWRD